MSRLTKLLGFLLCIVLLVSSIPNVFAQEAVAPAVEQVAETKQLCGEAPEPQVGPVVIGEVTEGRPTKGVTYHTTEAAAALELRAAMEDRQTTITIGFRSTAYTQEFIDYIYPTLKEQAVAHTGVDSQGDYLDKEYDGYSGSCSAYRSGGYYYCSLTYYMKYKTTAQQEAELTAALDQFISTNIESGMTDYEMFRVCYDWICQNITYDYDHLGDTSYKLQYTAYAAMINKTAVCQGYATLLYRMLLLCGIDNRYISGIANGGNHGWNIVQMDDGYYYNCDSTWDEGKTWQQYDYCLVCPSNYTDHSRDASFETAAFHALYPMGQSDYLAQELYAEKSVAVQQLRQCLKDRTGTFNLYISLNQAPTADLFQQLLSQAFTHNGVPDEGDYLRYHVYSTAPTMEYVTVGSKYFVTMSVKAVYYSTAAQETALTEVVDSFITTSIKAGMSDYEKFDAIYSWMSNNISYGYSGDGGSNAAAYTAMVHKGAAPRGFVTLLYRLLLECGVDCRVIKGTVNSGSATHFWNIIKLDGLYYNADPGWEASYMQSYGKYRYRLKCDATFTNHTRDAEYSTTAFYNAYSMGTADYTPTTKFDIDVARMILGNSLEFQFGVAKTRFTTTEGYYAIIEKEWADGTNTTKTVPASQWGTVGSYWAISYDGLAAKEMCDTFYVTIYNANGQAISNAKVDSVRDYVMRNVDKQDAEGRTMMVDMLGYGAAAQVNFSYGTDDLANSQLTAAQKGYGTTTVTTLKNNQGKGTNYLGTRLVLESSIQLQVAFKNLTADKYVIYSFTNHLGEVQTVRVDSADFVDAGGVYGVELSELVYADARQQAQVTVYNADGSVYGTASDSIEGYIQRNTKGDDVFAALMKFADAAYNYFH